MPEPDALTPDLDAAFAALGRQVGDHVPMPDTGTVVARGRRRVAVRAAAAAVAVLALVGTGAAALTRLDRPPVPVAVATAIPPGFLLFEGAADADPAALEYRTDTPTAWPPDLCAGREPGRVLARAERSFVFSDRTRAVRTERLDVFADTAAARSAFGDLRSAARDCAATVVPDAVADESLLIRDELPGERYTWTLYLRRGAAIAGYAGDDRALVEQDAATMAAKLCRYDPGC